jgi:cytochrome o ubiquinol oxidase operon protein cyoD
MTGAFDTFATVIVSVGTAVAQVLVQLVLFMHMNTKADEGWNFMSFVFTVAILVLVIGGSLWIMYHLHHNMMIG